jgi:apolipoprotein D and lipocalin family protein
MEANRNSFQLGVYVMAKGSLLSVLLVVAAAGCATGPPANVTPVSGFEVERYLGKWYEIARLDHRFERGLARVTAEYSLNKNGTIKVLNRGYNTKKGTWNSAEGKAKFRGDETDGSLKVSFFGPFYGGYHIFELGGEYQHVLVAGPSKKYLWILARSPEMEETIYRRLVERAKNLGFPTDELIRVSHAEVPL